MTLDIGRDMFEHTIRGFTGDMDEFVSQGLGKLKSQLIVLYHFSSDQISVLHEQ